METLVSDRILLRSHGGDGSAEIEALIGDKIFDLLLYWRLTRQYTIKDEGELTQLRSVYVSNKTMAKIGERFVVPRYMNRYEWEDASIHEKGTAVEAIVGRSFIEHNGRLGKVQAPSLPAETAAIAYEILDAIEICVKATASHILSDLSVDSSSSNGDAHTLGHKNPVQALYEWLQLKLKITKPGDTIKCYASSGIESGIKTATKFVAEFALPRNIRLSNFAALTEPIRSDLFPSKKLARDDVARRALRYFRIDSTLSFEAAMRKVPPSQAPPPSYLLPKPTTEPPPAYEKSASSRLYELLQKNGVSFPARTIEVVDVLGEDDVTRHGAFQGVFTMPNTDPPEVIRGAKFANKREAKENVATIVLAQYAVTSELSSVADVNASSDQTETRSRPLEPYLASSFNGSENGTVVVAASTRIVQSNRVSETEIISVTTSASATNNCSRSSSGQESSGDLAELWKKIQTGYMNAASSDRCESIMVCADPILAESSLEYVNEYLGKYCRNARITHDDIMQLIAPELAPDGDVSLPSIAGLLHFEPHTPWDSTPLREWFEVSWAKKPINTLWLLRARIGAQFMFKFWRCRLNGGVQTVHDALVLAAFWDRDFGPYYGIGVGVNPGPAAKSALAQLWPMVKPYVNQLISVAETKYAENEQLALEAIQRAVDAAKPI